MRLVAMLLTAGCLLVGGVYASAPRAEEPRPKRTAGDTNEGFTFDTMEFFSPGDRELLDGISMLFGIDVDSMINIVKIGLGVVDFVDRVYRKVFEGTGVERQFGSYIPNADRDMLAMFEVLSHRLDRIHMGLHGIESSLRDMVRGLPSMLRWEVMLDSLEDYTRPINSLYHRFAHYQKHRKEVEDHTLHDFAESVVSHNVHSIMGLMANVHSMVAPNAPPVPQSSLVEDAGLEYVMVGNRVNKHFNARYQITVEEKRRAGLLSPRQTAQRSDELSLRPSIFLMLEQMLKDYNQCELQQSHQQMALGLYFLVALTQARGYAMTNYAYMLLRIYNEGNFTVEQQLSRELYEHYSRSTAQQALEVIRRADNTFARCDPVVHEYGETYVMITELLQGHIVNEVDLNARGSCLNRCDGYRHATEHGCYLPSQQLCGIDKTCKGTLHACTFIDADADVCFSSNPYRRYEWVHYENGRTLGQRDGCSNKRKVDSWYRWFVHCSYCVCMCDDPASPTTERHISLLPAVTDLDDSMVLTGVKLSKHQRVVVLEVQQGRTMPQGQIDPSSLSWLPVPHLDVKSSAFQDGKHYHTLSYEARNLDLDHLRAPAGYVLTGISFRMLGHHLNLEIRVTPVNFETGKLNSNMSYWISNDNTPQTASPRTQLLLYLPDDPTKSPASSVVDSTSNMYTQFQATSLDADVSQLTVPFFDAQPVTTSPAGWLEGLNLYHKGRRGSGGFVGLQLVCYNATRHFEEQERKLAVIPIQ